MLIRDSWCRGGDCQEAGQNIGPVKRGRIFEVLPTFWKNRGSVRGMVSLVCIGIRRGLMVGSRVLFHKSDSFSFREKRQFFPNLPSDSLSLRGSLSLVRAAPFAAASFGQPHPSRQHPCRAAPFGQPRRPFAAASFLAAAPFKAGGFAISPLWWPVSSSASPPCPEGWLPGAA